jgi:DUF4097 and DUF4098 domain-containing protein YvlB
MNEERTMILKMLKDGKITLEEAEALIDVIEESERSGGASREEEAEGRNGVAGSESGSGPDEWWNRLFSRGPDIDFTELNKTLQETLGSIRSSVEQAVSGLGNLNLAAEINRALGNEKVECVQEATAPESDFTTLRLKNRWGDIRVLSDDGTTVRVRAICTAWGGSQAQAEASLSQIKIGFDRQAEILVLSAARERTSPFDRIRVDYEVTVPKSTGLNLGTASGDVSVADIAAAVSVTSLSGDIRAEGVQGTQRYLTRSGDVTLEAVEGEIKANTLSGDIRVRISGSASFRVTAATASGTVTAGVPLESQRVKKERVEGIINGGRDGLSLRTASGDISLSSI